VGLNPDLIENFEVIDEEGMVDIIQERVSVTKVLSRMNICKKVKIFEELLTLIHRFGRSDGLLAEWANEFLDDRLMNTIVAEIMLTWL
jgi:hypothetical protein